MNSCSDTLKTGFINTSEGRSGITGDFLPHEVLQFVSNNISETQRGQRVVQCPSATPTDVLKRVRLLHGVHSMAVSGVMRQQ